MNNGAGEHVFDNVDEVLQGRIIDHTKKNASKGPQDHANPEDYFFEDETAPEKKNRTMVAVILCGIAFLITVCFFFVNHTARSRRSHHWFRRG